MEPRTPRNAKIPPNKNSITNGQTAKGQEAAVPLLGGLQWNSNFDAWWVLQNKIVSTLPRPTGVSRKGLTQKLGKSHKRLYQRFREPQGSAAKG